MNIVDCGKPMQELFRTCDMNGVFINWQINGLPSFSPILILLVIIVIIGCFLILKQFQEENRKKNEVNEINKWIKKREEEAEKGGEKEMNKDDVMGIILMSYAVITAIVVAYGLTSIFL